MMMSLFNMTRTYSSQNGPKPFQLTTSKYMVGRDVNPITETSALGACRRDVVRADGDDVRLTSKTIFDQAKNMAKNGNFVRNFRDVDVSNPDSIDVSQTVDSPTAENRFARSQKDLFRNDTHKVTFGNNTLTVWEKDTEGEWNIVEAQVASDDLRLAWNKDGSPSILVGNEARSVDGTLKAANVNEIIVRVSGRDVEAGAGTVVLNLSDKKGTFSGGDGVTYLGSYGKEAVINSGKGINTYAGFFDGAEIIDEEGIGNYTGVFENLSLSGNNLGNSFSGYFSNVQIVGGDGKNTFSGMFIAGSTVQGGADDDRFNGRYVDSSLNGGKGNDIFGQGIDLNENAVLNADGKVYDVSYEADNRVYGGVMSDFVDSDVISGEGNNTVDAMVWGGKIELGSGNDEVRGAFIHASIDVGGGDDNIASLYSESSFFNTGSGNNKVTLATARHNSLTTGAGNNSINMGVNPGTKGTHAGEELGGDNALAKTTFSSKEEIKYYRDGTMRIGMRYGELEGNQLNAEMGQNDIQVNNGTGAQSLLIGNGEEAKKDSLEASKEEDAKSVPQNEDKPGDDFSASLSADLATVQADSTDTLTQALGDDRYALLTGEGPEKDGGSALKVKTGAGEDIDMRYNARSNRVDQINKDHIQTYVRRFNGYSSKSVKY